MAVPTAQTRPNKKSAPTAMPPTHIPPLLLARAMDDGSWRSYPQPTSPLRLNTSNMLLVQTAPAGGLASSQMGRGEKRGALRAVRETVQVVPQRTPRHHRDLLQKHSPATKLERVYRPRRKERAGWPTQR